MCYRLILVQQPHVLLWAAYCCVYRQWQVYGPFQCLFILTQVCFLSPCRTLEWHQDYFSSLKDTLVLRPHVKGRIALRYKALRLAALSPLSEKDLQRAAVEDLFNLHSYPHQTSTELNDSFTRFYGMVINTFPFTLFFSKFDQNTLRWPSGFCLSNIYNVFILVNLWDYFIFVGQKSLAGVSTQDALLSARICVEWFCRC